MRKDTNHIALLNSEVHTGSAKGPDKQLPTVRLQEDPDVYHRWKCVGAKSVESLLARQIYHDDVVRLVGEETNSYALEEFAKRFHTAIESQLLADSVARVSRDGATGTSEESAEQPLQQENQQPQFATLAREFKKRKHMSWSRETLIII